jgi:hypothetical protein
MNGRRRDETREPAAIAASQGCAPDHLGRVSRACRGPRRGVSAGGLVTLRRALVSERLSAGAARQDA